MLHTSPRKEESRVDQQQSRWRRIGRQFLWTIGAIVAVSAVVFVINRFFVHHPLWDWIKLLIVPAVIAGGGLWFNRQQRGRELETAREQREREQRIANERAQDEALQGYLDGMSQLLTDKEQPLHNAQPGDTLSTVARARTLTVLGRLDSDRKTSVVQFLFESGLIYKEHTLLGGTDLIERRHNIVRLDQANLRETDLSKADLNYANLMNAILSKANLSEANLNHARLHEADLSGALLSEADLSEAYLTDTNLRGANMREAKLSGALLSKADLSYADLSHADLSHADLSHADIRGTKLSHADLSGANLSGASGITNKELKQHLVSLEGATMPNGQKYEDWLKSKDREENGKYDGSS
jgi:uncharacterized protein YjbI with pentapeptide repeats